MNLILEFSGEKNLTKTLHDALKLKAANNELIWNGWYPPHFTVKIIQVKPGGSVVPLKTMMVFLIHLYIYFFMVIFS